MRSLRLLSAVLLSTAACGPSPSDKPAAKSDGAATAASAADTASYPAAKGFDYAGSDARAMALADKVMRQMGGYPAWQQTRLVGWDFLDGSYQLWDKQTGDFRWQKDSLVGLYNLTSKQGHVYKAGQDISATPDGQKLLTNLHPIWVNNSWWLLMPFKLKDSGVTLTYQGAGKLMDGTPAEVLHMTFRNVGVTPDNPESHRRATCLPPSLGQLPPVRPPAARHRPHRRQRRPPPRPRRGLRFRARRPHDEQGAGAKVVSHEACSAEIHSAHERSE